MPSAETTSDFLRALDASGCLAAKQLQEIESWAKSSQADSLAVAKELNRRGWLTAHQIREIYRGRGRDLTIGVYRVLDLVGEGGMGRVYKSHHSRLNRTVALKVIRKEKLNNPQTVRRFRQEIQAVAQLSHPNVVMAFDADEANGDHFLAMEYVDGIDLTKMVRERGPLPIPEACDYIRQAALGLQHAHERGLVHRDIKPSNIMAAKNGQVKLLDLGLAMLNEAQEASSNRVTQEGYVIGTPDFLAPEQAKNPLDVDIRADIYALGATLYYLLTGKVPYDVATPTEKLLRHVTDPPPQLRKYVPQAPVELDRLIQWAMAKDPAERPQTPQQFAMYLTSYCPAGANSSKEILPLPAPVAPSLVDPTGSSQAFRLPASEAPARVRERTQHQKGFTGWAVGLVAMVALAVCGYLLFEYFLRPEPAPAPTYTNSLGMKFSLIPPGSFAMGSPATEPGRGLEEGPVTEVTLTDAFYIGTTEVTNQQFAALMSRTTSWAAGQARNSQELPVESVTWQEANEFCEKLNSRDRTKRKGWVYRLPTEAEWEYACRAGTKSAFSFGDQLRLEHGETITFASEDEELKNKPPRLPNIVGQSLANPFGLQDCHGNVSEWCQDYFLRSLPGEPCTNPTGPASGDIRVVRGGAFNLEQAQARSASRRGLTPEARHVNIGFRVVLARLPKAP